VPSDGDLELSDDVLSELYDDFSDFLCRPAHISRVVDTTDHIELAEGEIRAEEYVRRLAERPPLPGAHHVRHSWNRREVARAREVYLETLKKDYAQADATIAACARLRPQSRRRRIGTTLVISLEILPAIFLVANLALVGAGLEQGRLGEWSRPSVLAVVVCFVLAIVAVYRPVALTARSSLLAAASAATLSIVALTGVSIAVGASPATRPTTLATPPSPRVAAHEEPADGEAVAEHRRELLHARAAAARARSRTSAARAQAPDISEDAP
jgi:hypothetical protein